jgi:hydroxymethylglutaryl-CoA lyase
MSSSVKIVEVSPRDGLQNEKSAVSTEVKIELINRLSAAGCANIEATSFVSPKWVPQLADGAEVMERITRRPGVTYSVLAPNLQGAQKALLAKADEVVIFTAASETFCQKNTNCTIEQSFDRYAAVADAVKGNSIRLRGSISCCFGCPYEGEVPILIEQLHDAIHTRSNKAKTLEESRRRAQDLQGKIPYLHYHHRRPMLQDKHSPNSRFQLRYST